MALSRHYGLREFHFWSPLMGRDAVRLSMANERGEEYFALVPDLDGPAWRKLKQEAWEALSEAIEADMKPGEIRWRRAGEVAE
jgi:hypothetical protein